MIKVYFPRGWVHGQCLGWLAVRGYYFGHSLSLRLKDGQWWYWHW